MATPKKTAATPAEKDASTTQGETTMATSAGEAPELAANSVVTQAGSDLEAAVSEHYGASKPTIVNGKSVAGKVFDEASGEWVVDPDANSGVRPQDFFDRIGDAFTHEAQRLVIEELAHLIGLTPDSTQDLPSKHPTRGKSTASMRTDITGRGSYAGGRGTKGAEPVAPGVDGSATAPAAPTETASE